MQLHSEASVFQQRSPRGRQPTETAGDLPPRLTISEEVVVWVDAVRTKLYELRRLSVGWDGYRGVPAREDVTSFAIVLLSMISRPTTPAPAIVPLSSGGLQLEWHTDEVDIELKVLAPLSVEAWVCDPQIEDDEGVTLQLKWDYTSLAPWIQKLG